MIYYAGLDISMKSTSVAIVNEKGKICFETMCETDPEILAQTLSASGFVCEKIGIYPFHLKMLVFAAPNPLYQTIVRGLILLILSLLRSFGRGDLASPKTSIFKWNGYRSRMY